MFNFNPDLMQLDDGATGGRRVAGTPNPSVSEEALAAILAEENAKYDPVTGMPLDLLESDIPEVRQSFTKPGFTPGPFPKEFEKFFGPADPNMLGYKIVTNSDGSQQLEVQTGPNSSSTFGAPIKVNADGTVVPFEKKVVNTKSTVTTTSPTSFTASDGRTFTTLADQLTYQATLDKAKGERQSAYDLLFSEFSKYGLGSLVEPLKGLIQQGVSPSEFTIQLRNTPQYQRRFAANAKRVANGLAALNEAQYIGLEDQYQNIMRNYGLPEQYYARGDLGVQQGFEQFIGNDVSPVELEDRIQTAERRVRFANPEVGIALRTFYPDITNGDVLAYALDPKTALESLKRRITAAEVGSTAVQMGLATNVTDAEYLARYGVTKAQAQQGYQTISSFLPRAQQLSDIYSKQGVDPYTQATAEKEVFGVPGAAEAARQRKKIVDLETAAFSGSAGAAGGALARERAGGF
jgi:hypothetical protein